MKDRYEDDFLPYVPLSDADKEEATAIMFAGNPLFKKWAFLFFGKKNKGKQFRREFFQGVLGANNLCPLIPGDEVSQMKAVAQIETKMILGYVNLVRKVAKQCYRHVSGVTYLSLSDLIAEGVLALREAIYNYEHHETTNGREPAQFKTYAWRIIQRRLSMVVATSLDMGGVKSDAPELLAQYFQQKRKLPVDTKFDQVISSGSFTGRQKSDLHAMLVSFQRPDQCNEDCSLDSTSYSMGEIAQVAACDELERMAVQDSLRDAKLSPIEQELLIEKVDGGNRGFFTEIAKRHTNQKGEPLTRAGARMILKRAQDKVRRSLLRQGFVESAPVVLIEISEPVLATVAPLSMPVKPIVVQGIENNLGVPPEVLYNHVKRVAEGESRRKVNDALNTLGYNFSVTTLYYLAKMFKENKVKVVEVKIAA